MTVGIMCSCLPVTGPIFREYNLGSFSFAKLKPIMSFKNTFHRMKKQPAKDIRLETGILGSAIGDGKFLKTGDDSWNPCSSQTQQVTEPRDSPRHSEISLEPKITSP